MSNDIDATVLTILTDRLFIEVADPNLDLIDRGLIDSLGFTTLFTELEDRFGIIIELDDMDLERFRSPCRIGQFVDQKLNGSGLDQGGRT